MFSSNSARRRQRMLRQSPQNFLRLRFELHQFRPRRNIDQRPIEIQKYRHPPALTNLRSDAAPALQQIWNDLLIF
jgi:hypothetical protein